MQVRTLNNSKYNYNKEAEVIHGNAATGEQYSVKRVIYSEVPITLEMVKLHWDEMSEEAENLRKQHPWQVISAIDYQDIGGNQIIKFTPTTELIFPSRVPIFDEKGKQIVGEKNIRAEIEKRQEEWARLEREGRLQEHVEIHHTDDGKTVRIKFRAAPKMAHQNEIKNETEWLKIQEISDDQSEPSEKQHFFQSKQVNNKENAEISKPNNYLLNQRLAEKRVKEAVEYANFAIGINHFTEHLEKARQKLIAIQLDFDNKEPQIETKKEIQILLNRLDKREKQLKKNNRTKKTDSNSFLQLVKNNAITEINATFSEYQITEDELLSVDYHNWRNLINDFDDPTKISNFVKEITSAIRMLKEKKDTNEEFNESNNIELNKPVNPSNKTFFLLLLLLLIIVILSGFMIKTKKKH
ncbi:hypothetical protein [endosymbiont GvMRE of Glomus versiforme]|uniref:hypothetical protein n=1 Tax=endosymbiont GvMRE of Glomus versiforme TaxID=2039283 RepID=UPI000EDF891E|nr:hypothetical protein [endosymbiont GvMRE of Glomus versiforme]RHZ35221.1 hypothetical protein GvMRE_IIg42 [endosymbiont GvMRE of Glomus versiforme]